MLALGAAFLTLSTEYEPAINALLFGEILGVSSSQLLPVLLLAVLCVVAFLSLYRPLVFTSVAPDLAAAKGVNATLVEISFLPRYSRWRPRSPCPSSRPAHLLTDDRSTGRGTPALEASDPRADSDLSITLALATVWACPLPAPTSSTACRSASSVAPLVRSLILCARVRHARRGPCAALRNLRAMPDAHELLGAVPLLHPRGTPPVDLAVSGGPDSLGLLLLALDAGLDVAVHHVNHHAPAASDADALHVRGRCGEELRRVLHPSRRRNRPWRHFEARAAPREGPPCPKAS